MAAQQIFCPMHEAYLEALRARADPERAAGMQSYHKAPRDYLGLRNPQIDDLCKEWRGALDIPDRVALSDALWRTDIFEARVAAAKLLTQARLRPDDGPAWDLIASWCPDFDSWAIADHACMAGQKRPAEISARERILGWLASYVTDHQWFIQKAIGWWLRDLSRHDGPRVRKFIDAHGDAMKPFARKEALRHLR